MAREMDLPFNLGPGRLVTVSEDGLTQIVFGACSARILSEHHELLLLWSDYSLHLPSDPDKCLIIDAADSTLVLYNGFSGECFVLEIESSTVNSSEFERFIDASRTYITYISRGQAAEYNIPLLISASSQGLIQSGIGEVQPETGGVSTRIDQSADYIASGISRCSSMISSSIEWGSDRLKTHIDPSPTPMPVHACIRNSFQTLGSAASLMASGINNLSETIGHSFLATSDPDVEEGEPPVALQIAKSSVRGVCKVALACSDASLDVLKTTLGAASGLIAHKYGDELGQVVNNGSTVFYSARLASKALRRFCLQALFRSTRDGRSSVAGTEH
uniref:Senescence domain-containing protein n=1 Tax=Spongospora subterranea TaxID=70186 RepID=A0A0H5QYU0_9EUKA|eukprot:CRZ06877.1 hypothetical protein [Spongospora subterranea]